MIKLYLKNSDTRLLLLMTLLFLFGLMMIASATDVQMEGLTRQVQMQAISFVLGGVVLLLFFFIDYRVLGDFYKLIYILGIALLLLVYIPGLGIARGGARSWIDLGPIDLQTSELAKLCLILSLGRFLTNHEGRLEHLTDLLKVGLFITPYMALLLVQPDLGSALVFLVITLGMMLMKGVHFRWLVIGLVVLIVAMPLAYPRLESHQRERIDAFLNPNDPSLPGNYHVMQSKITIGSGMENGRGIFEGTYHRNYYLPVQETDFIYSVIGEETGFIGGTAVIALYFLLLSRMITLAQRAKDEYGSLMIMGVTFMFTFQIVENIGMTMGVMPVTGITLPFLSYGGSSVVTNMMAIGLVETIYARRKRLSFMIDDA